MQHFKISWDYPFNAKDHYKICYDSTVSGSHNDFFITKKNLLYLEPLYKMIKPFEFYSWRNSVNNLEKLGSLYLGGNLWKAPQTFHVSAMPEHSLTPRCVETDSAVSTTPQRFQHMQTYPRNWNQIQKFYLYEQRT